MYTWNSDYIYIHIYICRYIKDSSLWVPLYVAVEISCDLRITKTSLRRAVKEFGPFNTVYLRDYNHSVFYD